MVLGGAANEREAAIAHAITQRKTHKDNNQTTAVLLEGLSDGKTCLIPDDATTIIRIAPGCLCCANQLIMRVSLNRLIRQKPTQLFLSLANTPHIEQIRYFLTTPDYARLLRLEDDICAAPIVTNLKKV